jgi:hypothetical protein
MQIMAERVTLAGDYREIHLWVAAARPHERSY